MNPSLLQRLLFLVKINYKKHPCWVSMIKKTNNTLLKLTNVCPKEWRMPKQNVGLMKSTVHLHGTFQDYLNHIKSHHVTQEGERQTTAQVARKAPGALQILTSLQQLGMRTKPKRKNSQFSTIKAFTKQKVWDSNAKIKEYPHRAALITRVSSHYYKVLPDAATTWS